MRNTTYIDSGMIIYEIHHVLKNLKQKEMKLIFCALKIAFMCVFIVFCK